jgi:hypothetical protein
MNPRECQQVRLDLMASFDHEAAPGSAERDSVARRHLATCAACDQWWQALASVDRKVATLSYPPTEVDLWPAIDRALQPSPSRQPAWRRLYVLIGLMLIWRALQLVVDLPLPMWQSIISVVIVLTALWQLARDPVAIQTFAPELQKRGV